MLTTITDKSKTSFENAAKKLNISTALPDHSMLREDLALYLTAVYMLAVIIEADKDCQIYDITDHSHRKYEIIHHSDEGYVPGSSGGGFSFFDYVFAHDFSCVGARLSFNSWNDAKASAENYPDLWEIVILNVK